MLDDQPGKPWQRKHKTTQQTATLSDKYPSLHCFHIGFTAIIADSPIHPDPWSQRVRARANQPHRHPSHEPYRTSRNKTQSTAQLRPRYTPPPARLKTLTHNTTQKKKKETDNKHTMRLHRKQKLQSLLRYHQRYMHY